MERLGLRAVTGPSGANRAATHGAAFHSTASASAGSRHQTSFDAGTCSVHRIDGGGLPALIAIEPDDLEQCAEHGAGEAPGDRYRVGAAHPRVTCAPRAGPRDLAHRHKLGRPEQDLPMHRGFDRLLHTVLAVPIHGVSSSVPCWTLHLLTCA